jgi:hypothetical protein
MLTVVQADLAVTNSVNPWIYYYYLVLGQIVLDRPDNDRDCKPSQRDGFE